jgi:hypothetical protein
MPWTDDAIAYLRRHRDYVRADLEAVRSGKRRISEREADQFVDVTALWTGKYERQLAYIDAIIAAHDRAAKF